MEHTERNFQAQQELVEPVWISDPSTVCGNRNQDPELSNRSQHPRQGYR